MKSTTLILILSLFPIFVSATCLHDSYEKSEIADTNILDLNEPHWGIGIDLQTKYTWRGMEMMTQKSSPVIFPSVNYSWEGLFVYAMGGYAVNGEYAEVDLGISYTWKGGEYCEGDRIYAS